MLGIIDVDRLKAIFRRYLDLIIILLIIIIQSLVYFSIYTPRVGYVDVDDAAIVLGIAAFIVLVIILFRRSIEIPLARILNEIGWSVILIGVLHTALIQLVDIQYPFNEGFLDEIIQVVHDRLAVILGSGLIPIFFGLYIWVADIRSRESRFQSIISAMPVGVAVSNFNGKITLYNDRLTEILQVSKSKILAANLWDLLGLDFTEFIESHPDVSNKPAELDIIHKDDQELKAYLTVSIVSNREREDRTSYIVVISDVTSRRQAEEEREQQRRVISLYTSLLTHDVGNDLQAVLGYIEGSALVIDEDLERAKAMLRSAEAAGHRMANLTRMFTVNTMPTHVEVAPMLREVAKQSEIINMGLRIILEIDETAEDTRSPGGPLLPTAFENLFRNAAQHAGDNPVVHVTVNKEGEELIIVVTDNGPGISPEIRKSLFNRSDPRRENGLGLYLTKQIISSCGGVIGLEEQSQTRGASFRIRLPIIE